MTRSPRLLTFVHSTSVPPTGPGCFGGKMDVEDREDAASESLPSLVGPGVVRLESSTTAVLSGVKLSTTLLAAFWSAWALVSGVE